MHGVEWPAVLLLLPPSEGKAVPSRGKPLDLDGLSFPGLDAARRRVIDALAAVSARPDALDALDAPASAADVVAAQQHLAALPTVTAARLYTGVLYDALDHTGLSTSAKRRANRRLVVQSALFGWLRPADRVPTYRLSMGVDLPGVGKLARHWATALDDLAPDVVGDGSVVDLRSASYAAAWRPRGDVADRTVSVHVVRDGPDGRTAVSHMAKHTRGLVARHLLESGQDPRTPEAIAQVISGAFRVDLHDGRTGTVRRLDVVEPG